MLFRDLNGDEIPAGKVCRTLTADFLQGTLPTWLEVSSGTATYQLPNAGFGYLQVTTAATANAEATVRTSFDIASTNFEEIRWTVEAISLSGAGTSVRPSIAVDNPAAPTKGVEFYDDGSAATRSMLRVGANTAVETQYDWLDDSGTQRRTLVLRVFPKRGQVYVCENDQVFVYSTLAQDQGTALRPRVSMKTLTATSHYFRVSQLRLDLIHN